MAEQAMVAILTARSGKGDNLEACLLRLLANSQAEDGMIQYELHRRLDEPEQFVFYEIWRDEAAFAAHRDSAFMIEHRKRVEPFLASVTRLPIKRIRASSGDPA